MARPLSLTGSARQRARCGAALVVASLLLSACAEGGLAGNLRAAGVTSKPDEFMVLPTRPLEMPGDLASLPAPTPGAPNRVDLRPHAEAVAGLSGRPGVPGNADAGALVVAAGPRAPGIRSELAAEDVVVRQTNRGRLFERWILRDPELIAYGDMVLNAPLAFERMRAAGVAVPAASPKALDQ